MYWDRSMGGTRYLVTKLLLTMKLTIILLTTAFINVSAKRGFPGCYSFEEKYLARQGFLEVEKQADPVFL